MLVDFDLQLQLVMLKQDSFPGRCSLGKHAVLCFWLWLLCIVRGMTAYRHPQYQGHQTRLQPRVLPPLRSGSDGSGSVVREGESRKIPQRLLNFASEVVIYCATVINQ